MVEISPMSTAFTAERKAAGAEYLPALHRLGLDPECAAWVHHETRREFQFAIVTSLFDRVGPKKIYDALFKAYDHAATPKEFDPWIVLLCSPDSILGSRIHHSAELDPTRRVLEDGAVRTYVPQHTTWHLESAVGLRDVDYIIKPEWVYASRKLDNAVSSLKAWKRFEDAVDRLAA